MPTFLDRYVDIIDDHDAFVRAATTPLPWCVWANPSRATPALVESWLDRLGLDWQPLTWLDGAYRIAADPSMSLGTTLPFMTGLLHIQEEVSLLPSFLLQAQPGDRVLDTCAAPGGKTARVAAQLGGRGTVVANDRSVGRLRALRSIIDRLGLLNVAMTHFDAGTLPLRSGPYDRILADVPCSGEGTTRKNDELLLLRPAIPHDLETLHRVQVTILTRALRLLKPGGRLVYSTCTYAPEENEAVVHATIEALGWDRYQLQPVDVPGLPLAPGLTGWQDQAFHPSLARAARAYPHLHDAGGFFVAVIERDAEAT